MKSEGEVEVGESIEKSDIKSEWNEFQKEQEIERRKKQVRIEATGFKDFLKDLEDYYRDRGVFKVD